MCAALQKYRALSARLAAVRDAHGGEDSPEEDVVLDEMDEAWSQLSADEQALLDRESPDPSGRQIGQEILDGLRALKQGEKGGGSRVD